MMLGIMLALALLVLSAHLLHGAMRDAERMQRLLDESWKRKLREDQERSER